MTAQAGTGTGTDDSVVRRIEEVAAEDPGLAATAQVFGAILPVMRDAAIEVKPMDVTPRQVSEALAQGRPLLSVLDVELDSGAVEELLLELAEAVAVSADANGMEVLREAAAAARDIGRALDEGGLDIRSLLPHAAVGNAEVLRETAEDLDLDPGLLCLLAQTSLMPALYAARSQLAPLVEEAVWERGACPFCGAQAVFGELQGNNLAKHLRCSRCGGDWRARRLQCHLCGNEDHATLGILFPEGRGDRQRVEVCDRCKGYLKVITAFSPTPPELLPVEDLATAELDRIAIGRGYTRLISTEGSDCA